MEDIRAQDLESCLRSFSHEGDLHVLLGQELAKTYIFPSSVEGHMLITGATSGFARIPGVIVCEEWTNYSTAAKPIFQGMSVGLLLSPPQLGQLFLLSAECDVVS
ncbi:unnamed protein product [Prorocentrum cordatum]|uniref:Uncharacterized protein n=1 Tax=Prorocentrum cordatum TaxID=2364126 RepID=A0ABN9UQJ6_9DINO|nr:unnamed protein product [Polarella glacialis]